MTLIPLTLLLQAGNKAAGGTVPAWITLVTALAAPTIAALAIYFTNRREAQRLSTDNQREANRLNHETKLKETELKTELEHQRQLEERKERIRAYLQIAMAARILGVFEKIDPDEPGGRDDIATAVAEIQFVAHTSKVIEAAKNLGVACIDARRETAQAHNDGKDVRNEKEVYNAVNKAELARKYFIAAAREEVGLPAIEDEELLDFRDPLQAKFGLHHHPGPEGLTYEGP